MFSVLCCLVFTSCFILSSLPSSGVRPWLPLCAHTCLISPPCPDCLHLLPITLSLYVICLSFGLVSVCLCLSGQVMVAVRVAGFSVVAKFSFFSFSLLLFCSSVLSWCQGLLRGLRCTAFYTSNSPKDETLMHSRPTLCLALTVKWYQ